MWKNLRRKLCIFLCAIFICQGLPVQAERPTAGSLDFYSDGDIVGFIGDSITYASYTSASYMDLLSLYYHSRFPGREMEFRNLSADGYKISDVLNIYDQDPAFRGIDKAVVMLGTNEAILGIPTKDYIRSMSALVNRLKEDGLESSDILILSPPLCDENSSINFTKNGSRKWAFENQILEYMAQLEERTAEWGVHYMDLHTPMAALTEIIQQEDPANSLTKDAIHPNAAGQWLIACLILQAQGADMENLSKIVVPEEGEPKMPGNSFSDFYRGEKGVCMTLSPQVLPLPDNEELSFFRELLSQYTSCDSLLRQIFSVQGLSEDTVYCLWADEAELGHFTGKELEKGIDLGVLDTYPPQQAVLQAEKLSRQRHQEMIAGRDMWIEVMMQRAFYTPGQIQAAYENWRTADEALRIEIDCLGREAAGKAFRLTVAEEGYSPESLEQEARKAAEEQARREAEKAARKNGDEQEIKEAEAGTRKNAEADASSGGQETGAAEEVTTTAVEPATGEAKETATSAADLATGEAENPATTKQTMGKNAAELAANTHNSLLRKILIGGCVLLIALSIFCIAVKKKKS